MDMKKLRIRKSQNENIFDTLSKSEWFISQCNLAREKYFQSENDRTLLNVSNLGG